jgi:hypothetical protein
MQLVRGLRLQLLLLLLASRRARCVTSSGSTANATTARRHRCCRCHSLLQGRIAAAAAAVCCCRRCCWLVHSKDDFGGLSQVLPTRGVALPLGARHVAGGCCNARQQLLGHLCALGDNDVNLVWQV